MRRKALAAVALAVVLGTALLVPAYGEICIGQRRDGRGWQTLGYFRSASPSEAVEPSVSLAFQKQNVRLTRPALDSTPK